MLFNSAGFILVFLPIYLLIVYCAPRGYTKSAALVLFSYLFYAGAEPFFVLILIFSSFVDYCAALQIFSSSRIIIKRFWLSASIIVNLGLLGFYKYGGWVFPYLSPILEPMGLPLPAADFFQGYYLPAGISFYTFQSMSYSFDVYKGTVRPERNLLSFCNYIAYLPQLIAGPIERFNKLHPQLLKLIDGRSTIHWSEGLDRIALGIAQKLLVADSCGLIVDRSLQAGTDYSWIDAWVIALGFGMQIYYDFAAYTHIAIGIALIMGIRLSENFNSPYKARNIQEFWRRWHMTLSSWFRDYVYIPMGGSRVGLVRTSFNILVTFLLIGFWHGAGWNFVVWGLLHGILLAGFRLKNQYLHYWIIPPPVAIGLTLMVVHFVWIPFRVEDSVQVVTIWQGMLGLHEIGPQISSMPDIVFLLLILAATLSFPNASERWPGISGWAESTALAVLGLFAILNSPQITQFIYFQF